ncbi:glycogenin glucosyltransferase [Dimargaris xerosporica]|nr:glycogenin glucosyltransferase [Dimargaris xerosporica]
MAYAYVTLVTRDDYVAGAVVLAQSLRATGTLHTLVCLATSESLTSDGLARLHAGFDTVLPVDERNSNDTANLDLLGRPDLGCTWTKLELWRLTNYDKVVYLDADTLVLANLDDLFTTKADFAAAPDIGWPDCFNSGVMVCQPSNDTYQRLIAAASNRGSFDGGDQGLLNDFFSHWSRSGPEHRLAFTDNFVSSPFYSYFPAFNRYKDGIRVVHFIGTSKPWRCHRFSDGQARLPAGTHDTAYPYLEQWWHHHDTFSAQFCPAEEKPLLPPVSVKEDTITQPGEPQFYKETAVPPLYQPDAQIRGPLPTPPAPLDQITVEQLQPDSPLTSATTVKSLFPSPHPTGSDEPQAFPSHYEAPPWVPDFTPERVFRPQPPPPLPQGSHEATASTLSEPSFLPPIERVSSFPREFTNILPEPGHTMVPESPLPTSVPHALYDHAYHQPHRRTPQELPSMAPETSSDSQFPAHAPNQSHPHWQHINATGSVDMVASNDAKFPITAPSNSTTHHAPPHKRHQHRIFANHNSQQAPNSQPVPPEPTVRPTPGQRAANLPTMPLNPSSLPHTLTPRPFSTDDPRLPADHQRPTLPIQSDETLNHLLQTFHEHLADITLPNLWQRPGHLADSSNPTRLSTATLDRVLTTLGLDPTRSNRERLATCLERLSLKPPMASSTTTRPVILPLPFEHTLVMETVVPGTRSNPDPQQWCTRITFQSMLADTSMLPAEFQPLNLHHVDTSSVKTHAFARAVPQDEPPVATESTAPPSLDVPVPPAPKLNPDNTDTTLLRTQEAQISSPLQEIIRTAMEIVSKETTEPLHEPADQGFPFDLASDHTGNPLEFADYRVDWDEQELGWDRFNPLSQMLRKHRAQRVGKRQ